ncbi:MAG TPA: universal stress protein [Gaiellaceae bacterium]|jgi:nucleotide-binding universal stress UspA family protein|nr:universal stress protein [Gaiellaceae bacterium]
MGGTIVCGVSGAAGGGREAAGLAAALGARLGLRLVLVSVLDGVPPAARDSLTARQQRTGAERMLQDLAREIGDRTELRLVHGERAEALAQVAAEEGADVIVVGSRPAGLGSKKLQSTLARELESVTPVPVLVAPPSTRRRSERRLALAAEANGR